MTEVSNGGYRLFSTALLVGATLTLTTQVDAPVAKAAVVALGMVVYAAAILVSKLRAPSPESVEHVLHNIVIPVGILLVLAALTVVATWQLYPN